MSHIWLVTWKAVNNKSTFLSSSSSSSSSCPCYRRRRFSSSVSLTNHSFTMCAGGHGRRCPGCYNQDDRNDCGRNDHPDPACVYERVTQGMCEKFSCKEYKRYSLWESPSILHCWWVFETQSMLSVQNDPSSRKLRTNLRNN